MQALHASKSIKICFEDSKMEVKRQVRSTAVWRRRCQVSIPSRPPVSEFWAGPAYLNSPPPTTLPMPHFAHVSPSPEGDHLTSAEAATRALRRSLNMDVGEPPMRDHMVSPEDATKNLCRMLKIDT